MPSELNNQMARSSGGAGPTSQHLEEGLPSQLIVVTFADEDQAQGLYEALKELDKKKIAHLEDAVFVTKNADGKYEIDEKRHHEKRTGTFKGATLGVFIGWMLGGPVLGLAGGAIVGRLIGKKMDLGVDEGTIKSVANDLENGQTALFILGSSKHRPTVVDTFKQFKGKIVSTTLDSDVQERLQQALDQDSQA